MALILNGKRSTLELFGANQPSFIHDNYALYMYFDLDEVDGMDSNNLNHITCNHKLLILLWPVELVLANLIDTFIVFIHAP